MSYEAGPLAPYYAAAEREAAVREVELPMRKMEWVIGEIKQHPPATGFAEVIANAAGVAIIAEHKRRSPTRDEIRLDSDVGRTVRQYQRGGATAVSVLTQAVDFGGRLADLGAAKRSTDLPILRKDFISNQYQLYESRLAGAAAVLLIVAGLSDTTLVELHEEANRLGMDCLVEVHTSEELERALGARADIIGINNRDLHTQEVDLKTARDLINEVPDDVIAVAESGYDVTDRQQMYDLRRQHFDGVLIGESVMLDPNPAVALRRWRRPSTWPSGQRRLL
jgi:indole-3-glycerol phosphate synthase